MVFYNLQLFDDADDSAPEFLGRQELDRDALGIENRTFDRPRAYRVKNQLACYPCPTCRREAARRHSFGDVVATPAMKGDLSTIKTVMPAARARDLQRQLPGLTGGEGVLETKLGGYEPVRGAPPTRHRTRANSPLQT